MNLINKIKYWPLKRALAKKHKIFNIKYLTIESWFNSKTKAEWKRLIEKNDLLFQIERRFFNSEQVIKFKLKKDMDMSLIIGQACWNKIRELPIANGSKIEILFRVND